MTRDFLIGLVLCALGVALFPILGWYALAFTAAGALLLAVTTQ